MNELLSLLIYILVAGIVLYAINLVIGMLALPAPIKTIILVVTSLVFLVWILRTLGVLVL